MRILAVQLLQAVCGFVVPMEALAADGGAHQLGVCGNALCEGGTPMTPLLQPAQGQTG